MKQQFTIVFSVILFQISATFAGISIDKCNEYKQLAPANQNTALRKRSLGKVATVPGEFPHMAALLFDDDKVLCGGSLISDQFVLTSAVCATTNHSGGLQKVRLGVHNVKTSVYDTKVQEFTIEKIIAHPDHEQPAYGDIALVKLNRPVNFTVYIRPACLQTEVDLKTDSVVGTGWGVTEFKGSLSDILMKVKMDVFTKEECNEAYKKNSRELKKGITDDLLCAGGKTESKDICTGDSGGPLQIPNKDKSNVYNIVGVISFGLQCGVIGVPGVATRVSSYVPWIEQLVWK